MSGLRCWPGCLAYFVDAQEPLNVGLLVEVLRLGSPDQDGPNWLVSPCREALASIDDDDVVVRPGEEALCPDAWLRPITPPPGSETESSGEPIKEAA